MNHEETEKVLDELNNVRPEKLSKDAKRLFNAIMTIADTKDKLFEENKELKMELREWKKKYGKI